MRGPDIVYYCFQVSVLSELLGVTICKADTWFFTGDLSTRGCE